jgi:hypothetical protein
MQDFACIFTDIMIHSFRKLYYCRKVYASLISWQSVKEIVFEGCESSNSSAHLLFIGNVSSLTTTGTYVLIDIPFED